MDSKSFSINDLVNKTFRVFGFYIFITRYFKKKFLCFTNVINLKLFANPAIVDNPGQVVTDFKKKVIKKKNKRVAKKKEWLAKFYVLVESFLSSHFRFFIILSSCYIFAPLFILNPLLFCYFIWYTLLFFVLDPLLFYYLLVCLFLFLILDFLLFYHLVIYPLQLHLQLFYYFIIFLFLIAKFQLFCYCFLYLIHLFFLDFHLSEHSNNFCQINLGSVY